MPKAIILNPTWEGAGRIFLETLQHSADEDDRQIAHDEIIRALKDYDRLLRAHTDYFEQKEVEVE